MKIERKQFKVCKWHLKNEKYYFDSEIFGCVFPCLQHLKCTMSVTIVLVAFQWGFFAIRSSILTAPPRKKKISPIPLPFNICLPPFLSRVLPGVPPAQTSQWLKVTAFYQSSSWWHFWQGQKLSLHFGTSLYPLWWVQKHNSY